MALKHIRIALLVLISACSCNSYAMDAQVKEEAETKKNKGKEYFFVQGLDPQVLYGSGHLEFVNKTQILNLLKDQWVTIEQLELYTKRAQEKMDAPWARLITVVDMMAMLLERRAQPNSSAGKKLDGKKLEEAIAKSEQILAQREVMYGYAYKKDGGH